MRQLPIKPPLQGEVDASHGADGGVRRPALPISFRAGADLSGGRERPPYNVSQACSTAGNDKPPRASAQGPMVFIGPPACLTDSGRSSVAARSRPQCRAGDFARRLGFAAWQGLGTMQASSPTDARQGAAKLYGVSPPRTGNAPLSRLRRQLPLQGSLPMRQLPIKPPLQGEVDAPHGADGGVRRLALPISFRAGANLSGGRERPPCKVRQACSTAGDDKPPRAPAQGPMISSARRRA